MEQRASRCSIKTQSVSERASKVRNKVFVEREKPATPVNMRILESTIEFVAFSALLLGTMTGHVASRVVWQCDPKGTTISLADRSFKFVAKDGSKNMVFSPGNLADILAMVIKGTGGDNVSQIRDLMKCQFHGADQRTREEAGQRPIQRNGESEKNRNVKYNRYGFEYPHYFQSSTIFHAKYFNLSDSYKEMAKQDYYASSKSVDFNCPAVARREMNRWISDQTHDRIKDLIKPDDIDCYTSIVFAGAAYLESIWVNRFDSHKTKMRPFHVNGGFSRNVSTMTTTAQFNYGELPDINAKFVELPSKSNPAYPPLSMFVIVPDSVDGIGELINNVEKMNIQRLHGGQKRNIELRLPKFEIESTIDLKELAENFTTPDIFTPTTANLTGMTSHRGSSVSRIILKTVIPVDETGINVAGGTGGFGNTSSAGKPILFHVDRPFIAIVADDLGPPYMMAVVADPSSKSSR